MLNFIYGIVLGFAFCFIFLAYMGSLDKKREIAKLKNDIENIRLNKLKDLSK